CIARIRAGGETYWLDATARYRPLEGLPFSDAGAAAVVGTPAGAEQGTLPPADPLDNSWQDELRLTVAEDGAAEISQTITGRGLVAVYLRANFGKATDVGERIRRIFSQFYGQDIESGSGRFISDGLGPDTVRLEARFRVPAYAALADSPCRLALPRAFLRGEIGRNAALPDKLENFATRSRRQCDVILPFPFAIQRDITLAWPEGWQADQIPAALRLETDFGLLERERWSGGNSLQVKTRLILRSSRIPVEDYPQFRRFAFLADRLEEQILLEKAKP
ncbi:MAG: DUF3858 domain-containing protein, partial [Planctomycetota bacterium]|nr:DUF3858 domain-containing protein [Planctomycetota bacterium]